MQQALNITSANAPGVTSVGGIVPIKTVKQLQAEERAAAVAANAEPVVQNLVAYIKKCWYYARTAKEYTIEIKMLKNVRARRGEYDPEKIAQLREQGSSLIYMMLTSNKCRAASSWLRDVLMTSSADKPWTIKPGPIPDMPPVLMNEVMAQAQQKIQEMLLQGINPNAA